MQPSKRTEVGSGSWLCENVVVEHRRFAIGAMGVRSGPPLAVGRKRHSERRRKTRSVPTNDNPCKPALSNMSIRCSERSSLRSLALGQTEQSARLRRARSCRRHLTADSRGPCIARRRPRWRASRGRRSRAGPTSSWPPVHVTVRSSRFLTALLLVAFAEMDYFRADCRAPARARLPDLRQRGGQ